MPNDNHILPKAVIFGLEGTVLQDKERSFFKTVSPLGFILFSRNINTPEQVKSLVVSLRECVGWHCPVLIDQEGGRVARLKPPHWRASPPVGIFASLAEHDLQKAVEVTYLNARLIGKELYDLGINVDCAPVADLQIEGAHGIVGDRSFGSTPEKVSLLARGMAKGLHDSGVISIIKHIPGHGRAKADSHEVLPVVDATLSTLMQTDFAVFKALCDLPWAMTAHILYPALDTVFPATLSKNIITFIRRDIGFEGFLVSDDLSMKALKGSYKERAAQSLEAGCDAVLHCNGKLQEMVEVAEGVRVLSEQAWQRFTSSLAVASSPQPIVVSEVEEKVQACMV